MVRGRRAELFGGDSDVAAEVAEFVAGKELRCVVVGVGVQGDGDKLFGVEVQDHEAVGPVAGFVGVRQPPPETERGALVDRVRAEKKKLKSGMSGGVVVGGDNHVKHVTQSEAVHRSAGFGSDAVGVDAAVDAAGGDQGESAAEVEAGDGVAAAILPALDVGHAAGELRVFRPGQVDTVRVFKEADQHVTFRGQSVGQPFFLDKKADEVADVFAAAVAAESQEGGGVGGGARLHVVRGKPRGDRVRVCRMMHRSRSTWGGCVAAGGDQSRRRCDGKEFQVVNSHRGMIVAVIGCGRQRVSENVADAIGRAVPRRLEGEAG